jgi:RimJ/RimL family protein N-acetyltransferase
MTAETFPLTDDHIVLRPLHPQETVGLYAAVMESLPELIPWMSWAHSNYQLADMERYIRVAMDGWAAGTIYAFSVTDQRDGAALGTVSLSQIHPFYHFCNLGYWIRSSRRGEGLAGRAARLVSRFAFERLGLVRVEVVIAAGNLASQRAAERCGATREGMLRNRILVHETLHDAVMYSFVPSDLGLSMQ